MKKGIVRKLILTSVGATAAITFVAATTAITLAAYDDGDGNNKDDSNSSSVSGSNNDAEDQPAEDENGMPNQAVSDDDNVNEVTATVSTFYTELFTTPIEGGNEGLIKAQEEMTLAVDGDTSVFEAANPADSIAALSDDKQNGLEEVTAKYSDGVRQAVNYDELSLPEKSTINMISLVFRGAVSGTDVDTSGMKVTVNTDNIEVDGDTANVPAANVVFSMANEEGEVTSDSNIATLDTPLVKTKDGWKVDGKEFINRLMTLETAPVTSE